MWRELPAPIKHKLIHLVGEVLAHGVPAMDTAAESTAAASAEVDKDGAA